MENSYLRTPTNKTTNNITSYPNKQNNQQHNIIPFLPFFLFIIITHTRPNKQERVIKTHTHTYTRTHKHTNAHPHTHTHTPKYMHKPLINTFKQHPKISTTKAQLQLFYLQIFYLWNDRIASQNYHLSSICCPDLNVFFVKILQKYKLETTVFNNSEI